MRRIGIIGPESVGKSTLCNTLSERCGYSWVAEYARGYVEALTRPYTYDDVCAIARRQIEELRQPLTFATRVGSKDVVLYDTELIITKVWMLHVFGKVAAEVEHYIQSQPMDLYLILMPDISAEPDPVRENLDKRDYFAQWYIREVERTRQPYYLISGQGEQRLAAAEGAITAFLSAHP